MMDKLEKKSGQEGMRSTAKLVEKLESVCLDSMRPKLVTKI